MDRKLRKAALGLVDRFSETMCDRKELLMKAAVLAILSLEEGEGKQQLGENDVEPMVGSVVVDKDGDAWGRDGDGWRLVRGADVYSPWRVLVRDYGPVGFLWEGEEET